MTTQQSLLKTALLEELSNGHFRLLQSENPQVPVSEIEFHNRKAARNWARGRGYVVSDGSAVDTKQDGRN